MDEPSGIPTSSQWSSISERKGLVFITVRLTCSCLLSQLQPLPDTTRYTGRKGVVTCILDGPRFPPFKEMISLPCSSFSRLFCPISTRCTSLSLDTSLPSYRSLFPCQFPRGRATSVFYQLGTGSISTITPLRQSFLTHAASKRNNTGLAVFSTFLFCARLLSQTVICRPKFLPDPRLISTQGNSRIPNTRVHISSGICSHLQAPLSVHSFESWNKQALLSTEG